MSKGSNRRPCDEQKIRDKWDYIFGVKKTPEEWSLEIQKEDFYNHMIDPDGWRFDDGVTLETPITKKDYIRRLGYCTRVIFKVDEKH